MDIAGSADRLTLIASDAANRYGRTGARAFNEVREYYLHANPRVPVILPTNNVPTGNLIINGVVAPLFANNPDYVREVRLIASNSRARFDYTDLLNANIQPDTLRTMSRAFAESVPSIPHELRRRPRIQQLLAHWSEDEAWFLYGDVMRNMYMTVRL